jgi:ABC-type transport system substrate-binding protein
MVDRVEVSIIEETQPRWLAFLNKQLDFINVPSEFVNLAMPNGVVAPNLAKQGIRAQRMLNPDSAFSYFNMDDPVVGGYTPEKVALRRAIALGTDLDRIISALYRNQAVRAQSISTPFTTGYEAGFKSENSEFDPARANALLDLYGYLDKDGDGWRDLPDGSPLKLEVSTQPDQLSRQKDELIRKDMDRLRIRVSFKSVKWAENLKAARAGKIQIWSLGSSADTDDGQSALARLYGPQAGSQNLAFFKNKEFDEIYERMQVIPDGPEREALFRKAKLISVAYMPYKLWVHRYSNDLLHPWLLGYRRTLFWHEWWHMVDIDNSKRPPK